MSHKQSSAKPALLRACLITLAILMPGGGSADDLGLSPEQIQAGQVLYKAKCASCHGRDASGASGPDVQGIILKDVLEAAEGVENMPTVPLDQSEAQAIASYLMSLAPDQARLRMKP